MKDLKFNILLTDKYSDKMRSLASTSDKSLGQLQRQLKKTGKLDTNLDSLENKLKFLEKKRKMSLDVKDMKHATSEIHKVKREIDLLETKAGMKQKKQGFLGSVAGKAGMALGGLALGAGALSLGKDVVDTTAKYEKFHAVLKNTYGSSMKASLAMKDLENFAAKTPFQIDELTDSFIKLENAGFKPAMSDMTKLGDLAASKGKSFDQLTEAILDAQMGEFERLKEFGIKGQSIKGGGYKFTFGTESKEVARTAEAVKAYMLSLGELTGVAGGMNAISKTTGGALSNLADSWDQLLNAMGSGQSGIMNEAIGGLGSLVQHAKSWFSVPLSEKMSMEKAGVNSLVSVITDYNTTSDQRTRLLAELQEQYPDFLTNMDIETVKNDQLLERLNAVNASYQKRIELQASAEVENSNKNLLTEAQQEQAHAQKQMQLYKMAQAGDEDAKRLYEENITLTDRWKGLEIGKIFTGPAAVGLLAEEWLDTDEFVEQYKKQINTAGKDIEKYQKKVNMSSAVTKKHEITAFVEDAETQTKGDNFKTLSDKDKDKFNQLKTQLLSVQSEISNKGVIEYGYRGSTVNLGEKAKKIQDEMTSLLSSKKAKKDKTESGEDSGTSGLSSLSTGTGKGTGNIDTGIDSIQGDNRTIKNMTINIENLVSGGVNVSTTTLREGAAEVRQLMIDAMLTVVNDVNTA